MLKRSCEQYVGGGGRRVTADDGSDWSGFGGG